ncbi:MarR family winged helix-turn-helix transcriptional regulator [Anaeroselena agilis]|uniref:MarR family transcriptional regulator n=1 Tax=Anaeroselena agilis TaxID=3063788 RepID=A0ABU3NXR5_9FIRM|nr:MarR family transcriptional regulator [Selenomonadales bacterium 4137-cl]
MEVSAINGLKNEILREVGALARCVHTLFDLKYRELSLQRGQFVFLTRIVERPGLNLAELSALLKVDKTTTTKAVQKLMAAGYVQRERDAVDKRMWRLIPSDLASDVYPGIIAEENRSIDVCFAGFSAGERAAALDLLARMRANIEREWLERKKGGGGEESVG